MRKIKYISVIIPCLNEEKSLDGCIKKAKKSLQFLSKKGYLSEIIVSDNGSTDNSVNIALKNNVRIVKENEKGYGVTVIRGINAAKGNFIVFGDGDGTYDFRQIPDFCKRLERGADLVLGSRFKGKHEKGAMPMLRKYVGNPILTKLINLFYGCKYTDTQTGLRAFTIDAFRKMRLKTKGMELTSVMIIKSMACKLKVEEIPINYYRRFGQSKLSPIKDALRNLVLIFILSPTYAFIIPGVLLFLISIILMIVLIPGPYPIGNGRTIDIHTLIVSTFMCIMSVNIILTGILAKIYSFKNMGIQGGILTNLILKYVSLERIFLTGLLIISIAVLFMLFLTGSWIAHGFSPLSEQRIFIASTGFGVIGGQLVFFSFLYELLH
jgi:glycosyltransferase involved in cell wall biosynthesis